MRGLAAEHFKLSPDIVFSYLAHILNYILQTGYVPKQLKEGVLTPVLKKEKDPSLPTNYRGITVLSILGKLLEKVILKRSDPILSINQSRLQRGFTRNSSSVNGALIITEAQNEAVDLREDLHLVTLDAAKAFDVVWQDSLMRKIYNAGVDGSLWLTTANLCRDAETSVKWSSHVSEPFKVQQGVRQGGVLSAQHCKLYNNDLLHMIVNLQTGTTIGHINCSTPPGFNCWFSSAPVFQWCCSTPQGSPGVGRNTFLSSPHLCFIIVFICDLFVSRDDPLMSWKTSTRTEQLYVLSHDRS